MDSQDSLPSTVLPVSTSSNPQDPEKVFSPKKRVSPSRHAKQSVPCDMSVSDAPVSTSSKPASIIASNTTINETQDVVKESPFCIRRNNSSMSKNSESEFDYSKSTTKTRDSEEFTSASTVTEGSYEFTSASTVTEGSYEFTSASTVTEGSYTSLSDDDSLGLLTESQLDSAWCSDSGSEDLFPNFQKFDAVSGFKDFPQIFNWPNTNQNVEPEISPICAREKSSNIDLSTLESTPRIKQSVHEIGKSSTRYHEDILNKTVKISSVCDDSLTTLTVVESDEESNLEKNVLNITHHIERDKEIETSLNRTFGTLNLNKTLPSVISSMESPSYLSSEENAKEIGKNVQHKTFTENPKEMINETKSFESDTKTYELPEHSQKMLSRTVTKIKSKKKQKTMENCPNSSWNRLDSTITLYPRSSVIETDLSQTTGTRQKTFKTDRGIQKLRKNYNSEMTKSLSNKTRKILSSPNRDLKTSTGYASNSFMSSGDIVPEISILPKKAPVNLSFKKIQKEPPSEKEMEKLRNERILLKNEDFLKKQYKESAKLRGFPDYKLSLYGSMKEIEKAKNRREAVDVTTIRLVEEADSEHRILSSYNRGVTPLMVSPSASRTPLSMTLHAQSQHRSSRIAKPTYKSDVSKVPNRSSDITRPQCRQQDQRRSSGRGYSRIPTLGQRAFGPQAIFGTSDPFGPPVRGRMSTVPKKNPGSNEPPFQK